MIDIPKGGTVRAVNLRTALEKQSFGPSVDVFDLAFDLAASDPTILQR